MADAFTMQRRYPMLRFASQVDWRHMKLALLNRLNQLGAETHQIIYVFSGYRSNAYSQQVGGFAGDPHTQGIAADARVGTVNGPTIGKFYSVKVLARYGLRSGNVPGFYKGKPDPEHVDLIGFGYDKNGQVAGSLAKDPYASRAPAAVEAPVGTQTTQPQLTPPPQTAPAPELTTPTALLPGSVSGEESPVGTFWKRVLESSVSPETQSYASLYGG